MPRISKGLTQAYELQDFTFQAAMSLKASLTKEGGSLKITREDARAIADLVRSWESAQERVRIHRNKPMPGSVRQPTAREKRQQADERERRRFQSLQSQSLQPVATQRSLADEMADQVKWEMRDVPGHPGVQQQVVTDSPALRALQKTPAPDSAPVSSNATTPGTPPNSIVEPDTQPPYRPAVRHEPEPGWANKVAALRAQRQRVQERRAKMLQRQPPALR